jgi:hypothetical protein
MSVSFRFLFFPRSLSCCVLDSSRKHCCWHELCTTKGCAQLIILLKYFISHTCIHNCYYYVLHMHYASKWKCLHSSCSHKIQKNMVVSGLWQDDALLSHQPNPSDAGNCSQLCVSAVLMVSWLWGKENGGALPPVTCCHLWSRVSELRK